MIKAVQPPLPSPGSYTLLLVWSISFLCCWVADSFMGGGLGGWFGSAGYGSSTFIPSRTSSSSLHSRIGCTPTTRSPFSATRAPWVLHAATREVVEEEEEGELEDVAIFPPRSRNDWVGLIKEKAGKPEVLELLQEAIKATGTGVLHEEFFRAIFPFPLDDFQLNALEALASRQSCIVSAPTGSGKTVAGELAIYYALAAGLRVFYTTPLKALSNQKFLDFGRQFGGEKVGLLTGDTTINRGAQVTVMTTEVYRNMLYSGDTAELEEVFAVVFDEFHYMNDPDRGTVWEESIILSPRHILFVALSATVANVHQVGGWISNVHGATQVIVSDFRPVPLRYLYMDSQGMYKLFEDEEAGPGAVRGLTKIIRPKGMIMEPKKAKKSSGKKKQKEAAAEKKKEIYEIAPTEMVVARHKGAIEILQPANPLLSKRSAREKRLLMESSFSRGPRGHPFGNKNRFQPSGQRFMANYKDLVEELQRRDLLPAIVFIFSRQGCDSAASEVGYLAKELSLLTKAEKDIVKERLQVFREQNPQVPLEKQRVRLLLQGVASHHAGLLPVYKSLVEELFTANLVKVVFATETLAAGVNMPARSTVITTISKKIGRTVIKLMPSQMLQMAGRAGRRGKDVLGHVVTMRSRTEDAMDAYHLICSPVDSIRSHFRSSYGMVVSVLRTRGLDSCKLLVEKNFGNYLKMHDLASDVQREQEMVERLMEKLKGVDMGELKMYGKLRDKYERAVRAEQDLVRESKKNEKRFVRTVLGSSRMGSGVLLKDDHVAALVGEVSLPHPPTKAIREYLVVITREGHLVALESSHLRSVESSSTSGISIESAYQLGRLAGEGVGMKWTPQEDGTFLAEFIEPDSEEAKELSGFLIELGEKIPDVSPAAPPSNLLAQRKLVASLQEQLEMSPVHGLAEGEDRDEMLLVLTELGRAEKRLKKKRKTLSGVEQSEWDDFLAAVEVLEAYGALNEEKKPTMMGELVASIRSDNELWTAMALLSDGLADLEPVDLVGVVSSLCNDIQKSDVRSKYTASSSAQQHLAMLEKARDYLLESQHEKGLMFSCTLDPTLAGAAQCWFAGFSWREVVEITTLDQGDLCRHFRRVVDLLRQVPVLPKGLVPERLKNAAREAADRMDRFPVTDDIPGYERRREEGGGKEEVEGEVEVETYEVEETIEDEEGLDGEDNVGASLYDFLSGIEGVDADATLAKLMKSPPSTGGFAGSRSVTPVFKRKTVRVSKADLLKKVQESEEEAKASWNQEEVGEEEEEDEYEEEEEGGEDTDEELQDEDGFHPFVSEDEEVAMEEALLQEGDEGYEDDDDDDDETSDELSEDEGDDESEDDYDDDDEDIDDDDMEWDVEADFMAVARGAANAKRGGFGKPGGDEKPSRTPLYFEDGEEEDMSGMEQLLEGSKPPGPRGRPG